MVALLTEYSITRWIPYMIPFHQVHVSPSRTTEPLVRRTINNIPLTVSPTLQYSASPPSNYSYYTSIYYETSDSNPYAILMDSGVTVEQSYEKLINSGSNNDYTYPSTHVATSLKGIPYFLIQNSKSTMDHKGVFHKGYTHFSPNLGFQFSVR